jgi:hydroxyacylglutathione hydrolase
MKVQIISVNLGFVKSFLVKGDRTIIVDAGLKGSSKRILKAMEAHGIAPADVSLLLVTHAHGYHTGGLKELKDATGAPVAVHTLEAQYLAQGSSAPVSMRSRMMKLLSFFIRGQKLDCVQPDVIIDGRLDLKPYGVVGYAFATPGHTLGSITLVTEGGEAIIGDMASGAGKPALPGVYDDLKLMKASIAGLASHAITMVYTSHGGAFPIRDILALGEKE